MANPKRVKNVGLCQALDKEGDRCDNQATIQGEYHGQETHLIYERTVWVLTFLCDYHGAEFVREWEANLSSKQWFRLKKQGKLMYPRFRTDGMGFDQDPPVGESY